MKFCKDCQHLVPDDYGFKYAKCRRTQGASRVNLVSGEQSPGEMNYCDMERQGGADRCGPDAEFFEARL